MIQPILKQHDIVDRLLNFCDKPLNDKVTMFSLNLLIKFMEHDQEEEAKQTVIDGSGTPIKRNKQLQVSLEFKKVYLF